MSDFDNIIKDSGRQKNFSIERLATVCRLFEAGTLKAAIANTGGNKQGQFTRQIQELEEFLGAEILDRSERPHRLNRVGIELVQVARRSLGDLDAFVGRCRRRPPRLVVAAGESMIQWVLIPRFLKPWLKDLKCGSIAFKNMQTLPSISALENGSVDLCFVRKDAVPPTMETSKDFPLKYSIFVPQSLQIKLKSPVTIDQLAAVPLVLPEGSGKRRSLVLRLAAEARIELNVIVDCSTSTQAAMLVNQGFCCAILPSFAGTHLGGNTLAYDLHEFEELNRSMCFAWNKNREDIRKLVDDATKAGTQKKPNARPK